MKTQSNVAYILRISLTLLVITAVVRSFLVAVTPLHLTMPRVWSPMSMRPTPAMPCRLPPLVLTVRSI